MVRRRWAAGVAVVLLIVIVLLINGCLKSEKQQSLKNYNREVSALAQESDAQVSHPLFVALTGAAGKSALDVEEQVDELLQAGAERRHARQGPERARRNGGRAAATCCWRSTCASKA